PPPISTMARGSHAEAGPQLHEPTAATDAGPLGVGLEREPLRQGYRALYLLPRRGSRLGSIHGRAADSQCQEAAGGSKACGLPPGPLGVQPVNAVDAVGETL